jgi:hypothetical protein
MCNAFRDHAGCFNLSVWISEPRKTEGSVESFPNIYLIFVPEKKFIKENEKFLKNSTCLSEQSNIKSILQKSK